jgi:hypothetical protein
LTIPFRPLDLMDIWGIFGFPGDKNIEIPKFGYSF